jgi:hypothetical protein
MAQPKKAVADKYIKQLISFEPIQYNLLIKYCQAEERSISWVVRKALEQYLPKDEKK